MVAPGIPGTDSPGFLLAGGTRKEWPDVERELPLVLSLDRDEEPTDAELLRLAGLTGEPDLRLLCLERREDRPDELPEERDRALAHRDLLAVLGEREDTRDPAVVSRFDGDAVRLQSPDE